MVRSSREQECELRAVRPAMKSQPDKGNRAEARCWGDRFSELDLSDPEFIPGRPERSLKFALPLPCTRFSCFFTFSLTR